MNYFKYHKRLPTIVILTARNIKYAAYIDRINYLVVHSPITKFLVGTLCTWPTLQRPMHSASPSLAALINIHHYSLLSALTILACHGEGDNRLSTHPGSVTACEKVLSTTVSQCEWSECKHLFVCLDNKVRTPDCFHLKLGTVWIIKCTECGSVNMIAYGNTARFH